MVRPTALTHIEINGTVVAAGVRHRRGIDFDIALQIAPARGNKTGELPDDPGLLPAGRELVVDLKAAQRSLTAAGVLVAQVIQSLLVLALWWILGASVLSGRDDRGAECGAGIYFARLRESPDVTSIRLLRLR